MVKKYFFFISESNIYLKKKSTDAIFPDNILISYNYV